MSAVRHVQNYQLLYWGEVLSHQKQAGYFNRLCKTN